MLGASLLRRVWRGLGLPPRRQIPARLRRQVQRRLPARYPPYDVAQLLDALQTIGIKRGATVLVHTAWDEFYNYRGKPLSVVKALGEFLGPDGTLVMPAFPLTLDPAQLFDVRTTPTGAGLLAELFRRGRGVRRSINLFHSVCALGPNADYLVRDHHRSVTPWDRLSPFWRLAELDGEILTLGLPRSFGLGTPMHCVESLLREEIPYFQRVFGTPVTYRYRDRHGIEGTHALLPRTGLWTAGRVRRHIDAQQVRVAHLSNLRLQAIGARYLVDRMVALGRAGIVNYYWPWPRRALFRASEERS